MTVSLRLASQEDAPTLWKMQVRSFAGLYERYRDTETSPAAEPLEKTQARLAMPDTRYYFILADGETAGAIRVVLSVRGADGALKRISPLFVLPEFRRKGIALAAIREAERLHGETGWSLDTILQEEGNCRLYERAGYRRTDFVEVVNERMTLVGYGK